MAKESAKFPYVNRKDKQVSVTLPEVANAPFSLESAFTRKKVAAKGPMVKPVKGQQFDVKASDVKLFYLLNIEGVEDLAIIEVGKLNAAEGLDVAFDITADSISVKENARVTIQSGKIEFKVRA